MERRLLLGVVFLVLCASTYGQDNGDVNDDVEPVPGVITDLGESSGQPVPAEGVPETDAGVETPQNNDTGT